MPSSQATTWSSPFRLLVGSFAGLILLGAALLGLPWCQAAEAVGWLDCLFTAASAVCVTGLITVDTATAWSPWGQALIAVLIQLGGLGIMTFSVGLLYLTGRRPGMASRMALRGALGATPPRELGLLLRDVIGYALLIEGIGAALLFARFVFDHPPHLALGLAVFHAVSAFCNAGFSMFGDSLVGYAKDPLINLTVMGLIFLGGIGFIILRELRLRLLDHTRRHPRLNLSARMALVTSLWLIIGGAAAIGLFELLAEGGPDFYNHLWEILFTSVTARTAGFNTIDLNLLCNSSLFVVMMLMFVGASPGSCGGGVKTTTLAVLWAMARSRLGGRPSTEAGGRTIPEAQVGVALALVLLALSVLSVATITLMSVGLAEPFLGHQRGDFLVLAFEAVSAFATVGLSMGATPLLTPTGKWMIIILMFIGRLGPLTLVYALAQRGRATGYCLAEEQVSLG